MVIVRESLAALGKMATTRACISNDGLCIIDLSRWLGISTNRSQQLDQRSDQWTSNATTARRARWRVEILRHEL
jgi:hypothetical protein